MNSKNNTTELENLNYNNYFKSNPEYSLARVASEHKESYRIINTNKEYLAKITGRQIFEAAKREDYPAVGDWVAITIEQEIAIIHHILPRKTILSKKYSNKQDAQVIATNIDIAFIVESVNSDYNLNRFERYFILATEGGIKPTIVLNKIDLISKEELNQKIEQIKDRFNNIDIITTSTVNEQGLKELTDYIAKGKTYCFLGSSGVGKSSLVNKLLGKDEIKTNEINSNDKGRHTTTSKQMYVLENGGIVIDTPGTREVGIITTNIGIENVFNEIIDLSKNCKYADCTHMHESGCAILKALEDKTLDEEKYQNYIKLKKESEYYEMSDNEKRGKDRKFGKFIKKTLKELKEFNS